MNHKDLVALAAKWLAAKRHSIVLTELATTGEEPDAIGWHGRTSTLIECKATRADFLSDRKKSFRREPWSGIGHYRYFMSPPGLIKINELPQNWGLLEVTGARVIRLVEAKYIVETNEAHEIVILLSTIKRIGKTAPAGISVRCYTMETKCRATLGIENP